MEIGILIFCVLAVMGGLIAFLGDKIGSKVGKKRISLFGMRPKHTSILVTVLTGIMIAAMTIGVLSALSENVRTALFGMEQLQGELSRLGSEVQQKNAELERSKAQLAEQTTEYNHMTERVRETNTQLALAQEQESYMRAQLQVVEDAYRKAQADVNASAEEIAQLEAMRGELTENIQKLDAEAERLRTNIVSLREGQVIFRVGQILSSAVVESHLNADQARQVLANVLNDTNRRLQKQLNTQEDTTLIRVLPATLEKASAELQNSAQKKLVRVVAAGNIIYGEPAWVDFVIHDDLLLYRQGETVYATDLSAYSGRANVEMRVLQFLQDVNQHATQKGVLPDPLTGTVGQVDGLQLFNTIQEIAAKGGDVNLRAVAKQDIYTEGPVRIDIIVTAK
ncbi:MAG: DUF3084 domain-containing protein [Negativicoccus succinicivorans]|uniref:DUF3084 domain-containing protein n=1 Tax=Negativicoccus succinicivorans TaxID=620903 RepID=UPI0005104891|nr:DUF3084 domain-containing protein [Negativicoccus succinicivorans]KGF12308.1 hypothetical protein HMPREF1633_01745 [Tissierellia bacterium S5-A11]MDU5943627.1 DUF3084 domain-containing protein [Negativicoccus succinicivorans]